MMRALWLAVAMTLAGCVSVSEPDISDAQRADRVRTLTTLALGYIEQGTFDLAVEPLQRALALSPTDREAMLAQAVMLERQGDTSQAVASYQSLFDEHADFTRGRQIYANFLFSNGQIEQACAQLESVVADTLYPSRAQAFENLGQCRNRLGDSTAAAAAFERAYRLDARRPAANLALSEIRFLENDVQQAAFHYTQFLRAAPQDARSLWIGIRIADAIGDIDSQASYELRLRQQFAGTEQHARWLEWQ